MPRISKAPDERRDEIIAAAVELFATKGYGATTVNDLLDAVGIAKGTFYYHFPSKEEVLRAVVLRIADRGLERARSVAAETDVPAADRVLRMIAAQRVMDDDAAVVASIHEAGNAEFHLLSHVATVNHLVPIIADVVREGIAEGAFDTPYPDEAVAILLTAATFLTDQGFEGYDPDLDRIVPALLDAAERLFGADPGTLLERAHLLGGD